MQLLRDWLAAEYLIPTDGVRLRIGEAAPTLEAAHPRAGRFAVLTAWNPGARAAAPAANLAAEAALDKRLIDAGLAFTPALNRAPGGGFEEPARLVLDLSLRDLDTLAFEFGQAGTLAWRRGDPVGLRLYGPAWRAVAETVCMDTAFIEWVACAPP